jgi:hypothetical protein
MPFVDRHVVLLLCAPGGGCRAQREKLPVRVSEKRVADSPAAVVPRIS